MGRVDDFAWSRLSPVAIWFSSNNSTLALVSIPPMHKDLSALYTNQSELNDSLRTFLFVLLRANAFASNTKVIQSKDVAMA